MLLVALMVIALLRSAANDGTDALEKAKVAQVRTTADSFNARVESSISSLGGLGARPWELTLRSAADQATLKTFAIDPDALSGTFLVDANDTVTNGVLLRPGMLGSKFDPPGWAKAKAELASSPAVVLPVASSGVTTELPSYAFAVAIRGKTPSSVRGAFVFEQALTNDSSFNQEIRGLAGERNVHRDLAVPGQQRRRGRLHPEHRAGITGARRTPALALARGCTRSATSSSSAPTYPSSGGTSCSPRTVRSSSSPWPDPCSRPASSSSCCCSPSASP